MRITLLCVVLFAALFSVIVSEEFSTTGVLKLRAKPCGPVITTLAKGTKVTVTSTQKIAACNYNWVPVKVNGKSGYVASQYLTKQSAARVAKPAPVKPAAAKPTPAKPTPAVKPVSKPTTASHTVATQTKRPTFSSMWNNYPDDESDALRSAKGLPQSFTNTCAIRLSYALMGSKISIPKTGFKDKFGNNIHIRVKEIMQFFTTIWGKPELKLKDEKDASKHKGIIVFTNCDFSDAFGHVDVWDGKECARGCYWDRCTTYHLWQLKD